MIEKKSTNGFSNLSRGADIWMHQARLYLMAFLVMTGVSLLAGLCVAYLYISNSMSETEATLSWKSSVAEFFILLGNPKAMIELSVDGKKEKISAAAVKEKYVAVSNNVERKIKNTFVFGLASAMSAFVAIFLLWSVYGKSKMLDKRIRGASKVSGAELSELLIARNEASPYRIAGVPMRKGSENLHTLMAGSQGVGKSEQFFELMRQVRARGLRMVVYDPSQEFIKEFYRDGIDIVMNPLDERSPNWNIWKEIKSDHHFNSMANGLIPEPAEADPFWTLAGRMVLSDVIRVLGTENRRTNADFYGAIAKSTLEELHALLLGTAGASYVDPVTERTGMSLKMTVQNQIEGFRFLRDDGPEFSIRDWVKNDSDQWMFITVKEEFREVVKPLMSLWVDVAMKAVLDMPPVHKERLWFALDELPTLQKLDILKLVLTNTRKYGLCCVLGVQDYSQLYEIYGHDLAKTIISGCQTKLILRVTDGAAAKLTSELIGQAEVDEKEESLSYGIKAERDGTTVSSKRNMRDIVMPSEITTLPDMSGFLIVPGDYPVATVKYAFSHRTTVAEGFIGRKGFDVNYEQATISHAKFDETSKKPSLSEVL